MSNGSRRRLSRGDRRRNEKLARLRAVITRESAVLAFDLAADKQVCAVTDPDSRVLARRTVRCKAWELTEAVAWGLARAAEAGFSSVVVACEPTGHRWRVLDQIAAAHGVVLVCVQPLLVARAREAEDFTRNKNDDTDAMIIARLVYRVALLPARAGRPDLGAAAAPRARAAPGWSPPPGRPASRSATCSSAPGRRCSTPPASRWTRRAGWPRSPSRWTASPPPVSWAVIGRAGWDDFAAAVRAELGATRWYSAIVRAVFDAATDPALSQIGVTGQRAGVLERVAFALSDLAARRTEITQVEARMLSVLDQLDLTELVTTIPGLSAIGAATILAETGDPTRFSSARALVKHAGLCPRDNASGTYQGKTADQRPRPTRAAPGRLAGGVHRTAPQPRAGRPPRPPDRPRRQPADRHPSPRRHRGQPAAPAARRDRHPHRLGPRHRRRSRPPRGRPGQDRSRHRRLSTLCRADHRAGRARIAVGTPIPQLTMSSPARLPPSPDEGCRDKPA